MTEDSARRARIGVGIVGYGLAGRVFHAPLVTSVDGLELRAIATSRADEVRAAYPGVAVAGGIDDVLADPSIELVVVATPNTSHVPLAAAALEAGRHVVVDKPFTNHSADADALIALAEAHGVVLSAYQNRRWDADFLTIRRLLREGALGRLHTYYGRFERWGSVTGIRTRWREEALEGSGLLYDLGAHLVDQALVLFGRPRTVQAIRRRQRPGAVVDDFFHVVLGFDGLDAILECSSFIRPSRPRFELYGEAGSFRKSGFDPQDAQINAGVRPGAAEWGIDPVPGLLATGEGDPGTVEEIPCERGSYEAFYEGMVRAIRAGAPPPVPAREARDVIRVIEYAIESDEAGRTIETEWAAAARAGSQAKP